MSAGGSRSHFRRSQKSAGVVLDRKCCARRVWSEGQFVCGVAVTRGHSGTCVIDLADQRLERVLAGVDGNRDAVELERSVGDCGESGRV